MTAVAVDCGYVTDRGQCKRGGNTVVAGVDQLLCKQHARIVATEPGQSGVMRAAPVGPDAIVAELALATTTADIERCQGAIARQIAVCADTDAGLKPELAIALQQARARVNGGRR